MSIFLYYSLEIYSILINILYKSHLYQIYLNTINYYNCLLVNWLMRRFWFILFFLIFSAIFAQITIFRNAHRPCQQYPNIVNKSLYHVYSFLPLFPHFHSTLHCPPPFLSESSGVQWSPAEWNWIPVNSTGLQTEIKIELESGNKYMDTNMVYILTLRVLWVYEETCLLPWISITFSVALTLNFAFLPRKLMVSHGQGFCSLCPAFVVFCQHFCGQHYKVLLTVWTVRWWRGFSLKMVITG